MFPDQMNTELNAGQLYCCKSDRKYSKLPIERHRGSWENIDGHGVQPKGDIMPFEHQADLGTFRVIPPPIVSTVNPGMVQSNVSNVVSEQWPNISAPNLDSRLHAVSVHDHVTSCPVLNYGTFPLTSQQISQVPHESTKQNLQYEDIAYGTSQGQSQPEDDNLNLMDEDLRICQSPSNTCTGKLQPVYSLSHALNKIDCTIKQAWDIPKHEPVSHMCSDYNESKPSGKYNCSWLPHSMEEISQHSFISDQGHHQEKPSASATSVRLKIGRSDKDKSSDICVSQIPLPLSTPVDTVTGRLDQISKYSLRPLRKLQYDISAHENAVDRMQSVINDVTQGPCLNQKGTEYNSLKLKEQPQHNTNACAISEVVSQGSKCIDSTKPDICKVTMNCTENTKAKKSVEICCKPDIPDYHNSYHVDFSSLVVPPPPPLPDPQALVIPPLPRDQPPLPKGPPPLPRDPPPPPPHILLEKDCETRVHNATGQIASEINTDYKLPKKYLLELHESDYHYSMFLNPRNKIYNRLVEEGGLKPSCDDHIFANEKHVSRKEELVNETSMIGLADSHCTPTDSSSNKDMGLNKPELLNILKRKNQPSLNKSKKHNIKEISCGKKVNYIKLDNVKAPKSEKKSSEIKTQGAKCEAKLSTFKLLNKKHTDSGPKKIAVTKLEPTESLEKQKQLNISETSNITANSLKVLLTRLDLSKNSYKTSESKSNRVSQRGLKKDYLAKLDADIQSSGNTLKNPGSQIKTGKQSSKAVKTNNIKDSVINNKTHCITSKLLLNSKRNENDAKIEYLQVGIGHKTLLKPTAATNKRLDKLQAKAGYTALQVNRSATCSKITKAQPVKEFNDSMVRNKSTHQFKENILPVLGKIEKTQKQDPIKTGKTELWQNTINVIPKAKCGGVAGENYLTRRKIASLPPKLRYKAMNNNDNLEIAKNPYCKNLPKLLVVTEKCIVNLNGRNRIKVNAAGPPKSVEASGEKKKNSVTSRAPLQKAKKVVEILESNSNMTKKPKYKNEPEVKEVIKAKHCLLLRAKALNKIKESYKPTGVAKSSIKSVSKLETTVSNVPVSCNAVNISCGRYLEGQSLNPSHVDGNKEKDSKFAASDTISGNLSTVLGSSFTPISVNPYTSYLDTPSTLTIPADSFHLRNSGCMSYHESPRQMLSSLNLPGFQHSVKHDSVNNKRENMHHTSLNTKTGKEPYRQNTVNTDSPVIDVDIVSQDSGGTPKLEIYDDLKNDFVRQKPMTTNAPSVNDSGSGNTLRTDTVLESSAVIADDGNVFSQPSFVVYPFLSSIKYSNHSIPYECAKNERTYFEKNDRPVFDPCFKKILRLPIDSLYKTEFKAPISLPKSIAAGDIEHPVTKYNVKTHNNSIEEGYMDLMQNQTDIPKDISEESLAARAKTKQSTHITHSSKDLAGKYIQDNENNSSDISEVLSDNWVQPLSKNEEQHNGVQLSASNKANQRNQVISEELACSSLSLPYSACSMQHTQPEVSVEESLTDVEDVFSFMDAQCPNTLIYKTRVNLDKVSFSTDENNLSADTFSSQTACLFEKCDLQVQNSSCKDSGMGINTRYTSYPDLDMLNKACEKASNYKQELVSSEKQNEMIDNTQIDPDLMDGNNQQNTDFVAKDFPSALTEVPFSNEKQANYCQIQNQSICSLKKLNDGCNLHIGEDEVIDGRLNGNLAPVYNFSKISSTEECFPVSNEIERKINVIAEDKNKKLNEAKPLDSIIKSQINDEMKESCTCSISNQTSVIVAAQDLSGYIPDPSSQNSSLISCLFDSMTTSNNSSKLLGVSKEGIPREANSDDLSERTFRCAQTFTEDCPKTEPVYEGCQKNEPVNEFSFSLDETRNARTLIVKEIESIDLLGSDYRSSYNNSVCCDSSGNDKEATSTICTDISSKEVSGVTNCDKLQCKLLELSDNDRYVNSQCKNESSFGINQDQAVTSTTDSLSAADKTRETAIQGVGGLKEPVDSNIVLCSGNGALDSINIISSEVYSAKACGSFSAAQKISGLSLGQSKESQATADTEHINSDGIDSCHTYLCELESGMDTKIESKIWTNDETSEHIGENFVETSSISSELAGSFETVSNGCEMFEKEMCELSYSRNTVEDLTEDLINPEPEQVQETVDELPPDLECVSDCSEEMETTFTLSDTPMTEHLQTIQKSPPVPILVPALSEHSKCQNHSFDFSGQNCNATVYKKTSGRKKISRIERCLFESAKDFLYNFDERKDRKCRKRNWLTDLNTFRFEKKRRKKTKLGDVALEDRHCSKGNWNAVCDQLKDEISTVALEFDKLEERHEEMVKYNK